LKGVASIEGDGLTDKQILLNTFGVLIETGAKAEQMTYMASGGGDVYGEDEGDHSVPESGEEDTPMAETEHDNDGEPKAKPRRWLENMRKDRHMSQRDLAKLMGCAQQTIQRFERLGIPMLDKWYFKLAEIFDVPVARLIALDGLHLVKVGAIILNGGDLIPQTDHPRGSRPPADMEMSQTRVAMIDDDSMEPRFYAGDLVFYDTVVESFKDALYKDCIVKLPGGEVFLRRVMPGRTPRVVTIEGYSPHVSAIENVEPDWIAPIRWTRHG
jgi:DNA-binding XRE family transcriptional regulator